MLLTIAYSATDLPVSKFNDQGDFVDFSDSSDFWSTKRILLDDIAGEPVGVCRRGVAPTRFIPGGKTISVCFTTHLS